MSQENVPTISNFANEGFLDILCLPRHISTEKKYIDRNEHCSFTWQEIDADKVGVTHHRNPILNNKSEI